MSKELLEKKEELESQIADINSALEREELIKEVKELTTITDTLNDLHQNGTLEKHCGYDANLLYDILQRVDSITEELKSDNDIEENDLY